MGNQLLVQVYVTSEGGPSGVTTTTDMSYLQPCMDKLGLVRPQLSDHGMRDDVNH